jgi:uncharacterized repeat protein (TIGR03837 family)
MHWDLFCRVVDNFGDIGVCWRLAADLAARGDRVRLWADDASALAWIAPDGAPGVEVLPWPADDDGGITPHETVVEAFGCHLPAGFVQRMAASHPPPAWINLEYLSAEDYVERNHGLRSPQLSGPAQGLDKRFFYPGFTARTGGLLARARSGCAPTGVRCARLAPRAGDRSGARRAQRESLLLCQSGAAGAARCAGGRPTLLLVTPGIAARQVQALLGPNARQRALRAHYLPPLTQPEYDHLLWSCDLNLVRGEDSFVRAQWAGKPFLWQIYPQDDGAHAAKLAAFHARWLAGAPPDLAAMVRAASLAWNGLAPLVARPAGVAGIVLPPLADWQAHAQAWRTQLGSLPDLTTNLRAFVREGR